MPEKKPKPQDAPRQDAPCQDPHQDVDDLIFSPDSDRQTVSQR